MASPTAVKPFSTEETQRILHHLQQPAVFKNMTCDWPARHWTAEQLSVCLSDKLIRFRLGRKAEMNTPLFETQCSYVEAKLVHFLSWTCGQSGTDVGPFSKFSHSEYWAYADYKYIAMLFQDQPSMFEDVKWSDFGFEGRDGRDSTIWIGTEGANTPCHQDSYGCNLVLQVQGRKQWHLFPPDDTSNLYPTRIPYEESSVFSRVDVLHPDTRKFPDFQKARVHTVTLQPGQVLFVPRHWWHYVESVDPVTVSVNSWIELEEDDVARVGEAVTKAVVCAMKGCPSDDNRDDWLNPTEDGATSHKDNMQYLNLAIRACAQRRTDLHSSALTSDPRDSRPAKRDSAGQIRNPGDRKTDSAPFSVPFGPHLISAEVKSSRKRVSESPEGHAVGSEATRRNKPAASALGLHWGKHGECSSGLTHRCAATRDCADGMSESSSEDCEESGDSIITTNDLLECLVHPDVVATVTGLLLAKRTRSHRTSAAS